MNHLEAGEFWEQNAEVWTTLVRAGSDIYRDYVNTPGFFQILPTVEGLTGLDVGCGEGHNTRLLAQKGAKMHAIDISPTFIKYAQAHEAAAPLGIRYQVASALSLPFADNSFDFVASFMCLMDFAETLEALREIRRVLKPQGFLQFSISHPCFSTPHRRNRRENGKTYAVEVGEYFRNLEGDFIEEWIFKSAPLEECAKLRPFRVPRFTRTLSQWFDMLIEAGFAVEKMHEPRPHEADIARIPALQDSAVVAYFLQIRGRKI